MLAPYRRHSKSCPEYTKGKNFSLCDCPIWCDGELNGARYRHSLQTRDWALAERRINRLLRGQQDDLVATPAPRTVASAVAEYLADAERRKLQASTTLSYRGTFNPFVKAFGKTSLADITAEHFRAYLENRKLAPRTERKQVEHFRAFFHFAIEREWIVSNVAKKYRPAMPEDLGTQPFTTAEVKALLKATKEISGMHKGESPAVRRRARALILTLLYSGLRVSDVAALRRDALDKSNHLTLRTAKTGAPVKVLLHKDAIAALEKLPLHPGGEHFFWSGKSTLRAATGSLWRTVDRVGKLAKVHATPHRFRDTFAVALLTHGADIRSVQMLLGHDSVKTTEKHYAHFVAAHQALLDTAAARLSF